MNINDVGQAAKMDIATTVILAACILAVAVSLEISAPVVAGVGAVGAAVTGVARAFYRR